MSTGIDIISDMYLNAAIPDAEFARERNVVLEEIKMYADEPDAVASENLSRIMFPGNSLGLPIAGSARTLQAITPQTLRDYIAKAYVPQATVAVVAGRFDAGAVRRRIAGTLGTRKGGAPLSFAAVKARPRPIRQIRAERDVQQTQLAIGYRMFGVHAPLKKRAAANVFNGLMGRSMISRLFQSVREKRGLSYDIQSQIQFFEDVGGWAITAGLDSRRAEQAVEVIDRELRRICARKPFAAELRRTKDYLTGNFRLGLEQVRSRMFFFGNCALSDGDVRSPQEIVDGIASVAADDVLAVANEILQDRNRSVSWVVPKGR
ncbi:MAG: M16 family metallopeptidase [Kiritimatiellia bacterium]